MTSFRIRIVLSVFFVLCVAVVAVVFYKVRGGEGDSQSDIVLKDNGSLKTNLIKNDELNFSVETSNFYYVGISPSGKFQVSEKEIDKNSAGIPGCSVLITRESFDISSLKKDVLDACKAEKECEDVSYDEIKVFEKKYIRVVYNGDYVGSGMPKYVLVDNALRKLVFDFTCSNDEFIQDILK